MLDKSIEHIGVLMTMEDPTQYPHYDLPEGYTLCPYEPGMEEDWARIHVRIGQMATQEEALAVFHKDFPQPEAVLRRYCRFVRSPQGQVVATASLWPGQEFGQTHWRFHWLAVHPDHGRRGIGRALVTAIQDLYQEQQEAVPFFYLVSQTWNYVAIRMYTTLGFAPYLGPKPAGWPGTEADFARDNARAWRLIAEHAGLTGLTL